MRDGIPDGGRCTGGDCCLAAGGERPSCNGGFQVVQYDSGYTWFVHWTSYGCCQYHSPPPPPAAITSSRAESDGGGGAAIGIILIGGAPAPTHLSE